MSSPTVSHCLTEALLLLTLPFSVLSLPKGSQTSLKLLHSLGTATGNQEGPQILACLLELAAFPLAAASLTGALPAPHIRVTAQAELTCAILTLLPFLKLESWGFNGRFRKFDTRSFDSPSELSWLNSLESQSGNTF